jgi:hypothetical protein
MSRVTRQFSAGLIALLAAAALSHAAPAPSDASPFAAVPASAPIVISVRGVEGTTDRFLVMLKKALPEYAGTLEGILKSVMDGTYTEGRKPRGLQKNGPIFVVFTEMPKAPDEPKAALVVAITKYEEFRDNAFTEEERKSLKTNKAGYESITTSFGETFHLVNKKEFAVVTTSSDIAESFTKKQPGIDERISKEQAARLLAGDVGVYVSMDTLNKEYAEQIKQAKTTLLSTLDSASDMVDQSQRGGLLMVKKLIDPVFQAVEDSRGIVLTLEFRPAGLALHLETELRKGTPTAKALGGSKLSAFKGLEKMPGGQITYVGMESNKAIMSTLAEIMLSASLGGDEKQVKAAQAAVEAIANAEPGTRLEAYNIPMAGIQVAHFGDPAKALAAQLDLVNVLNSGLTYAGGVLKEKPTVTPKAKKYGDIEFTSVKLVWDPEKMAEGAGKGTPLPDDAKKQLAEAMKKILGESQTSWVGTDGKAVWQVTAKDWETAKKLLDNHAKGSDTAGKLEAFTSVRKELPAEANIVAMADMVRYLGIMLDITKPMLESMLPLPVKIPSGATGLPPTYCGTAVVLKGDRASLDVFISGDTVHEIYKAYVLPLIGAAGGAAN